MRFDELKVGEFFMTEDLVDKRQDNYGIWYKVGRDLTVFFAFEGKKKGKNKHNLCVSNLWKNSEVEIVPIEITGFSFDFEFPELKKEMTVAEIEEALGYQIKIVK